MVHFELCSLSFINLCINLLILKSAAVSSNKSLIGFVESNSTTYSLKMQNIISNHYFRFASHGADIIFLDYFFSQISTTW